MTADIPLQNGYARIQRHCPILGCRHQVSMVGVPTVVKLRTDPPVVSAAANRCAEAIREHLAHCHRGVQ